MKIGQLIRNKSTGEQAMVYQVTKDKTVAVKVYEIKNEENSQWQFVMNLTSDERDILPRYEPVTKVLWCEDKRKDNDFNAYEIEKMKEAAIVLLYNKSKKSYHVLKNRFGIMSIDIPTNVIDKFLMKPDGKLEVEWR